MLGRLSSRLKPGDSILDIGKSQSWGTFYKEYFQDFDYKTVDRHAEVKPDIISDIESTQITPSSFDAAILMGCSEQCFNPINLIRGIQTILKPNGLLLAGILSINYPIYSTDYQRFTPKGAERLLMNFDILEKEVVCENGIDVPTVLFYIGKLRKFT